MYFWWKLQNVYMKSDPIDNEQQWSVQQRLDEIGDPFSEHAALGLLQDLANSLKHYSLMSRLHIHVNRPVLVLPRDTFFFCAKLNGTWQSRGSEQVYVTITEHTYVAVTGSTLRLYRKWPRATYTP